MDGFIWVYICIMLLLFGVIPTLREYYSPEQKWLREHEQRRRREHEESEALRNANEREELARTKWEKTTEGQAFLERQRRELVELQRRMAAEADVRRVQDERRRAEAEERIANEEWNAFFQSKSMHEVASMTGVEFERFVARLLSHLGCSSIALTPVNDQGGDITCVSPSGDKVVVQAKRWKGSLGNAVVQEILGAMLHYGCNCGMIVTNSRFTTAARTLAGKDPRIALCDGHWLKEHVDKHIAPQIPPFDWERYKKEVKPLALNNRRATTNVPVSTSGRVYRSKEVILADVAEGRIEVEEASRLLAQFSARHGGRRRANH